MRVFNAPTVSDPHPTGTLELSETSRDRHSPSERYMPQWGTDFLHTDGPNAKATRRLVGSPTRRRSRFLRPWMALPLLVGLFSLVLWLAPGPLLLLVSVGLLTWALWLIGRP